MYLKRESRHRLLALSFFICPSAHSSLHKAESSAYTNSNTKPEKSKIKAKPSKVKQSLKFRDRTKNSNHVTRENKENALK